MIILIINIFYIILFDYENVINIIYDTKRYAIYRKKFKVLEQKRMLFFILKHLLIYNLFYKRTKAFEEAFVCFFYLNNKKCAIHLLPSGNCSSAWFFSP